MAIRTGWVGSSAKAETGQAWMSPARTRVRLPAAGWMSEMVGRSVEIIMRTVRDTANMDIYTYFGRPTKAAPYILYIDHQMYSNSSGNPAMTTGVFPAGSTLELRISGDIRGAGGNGGHWSGGGSAGGTALHVSTPTKISNNGYIFGGGGGGGGQYGTVEAKNGRIHFGNSGGGGAGRIAGSGGGVGRYGSASGSAGTLTTGGTMQVFDGSSSNSRRPSGGALGERGFTYSWSRPAGRGGYSIQGIRNVTWLSGNNTTQVKGAQV